MSGPTDVVARRRRHLTVVRMNNTAPQPSPAPDSRHVVLEATGADGHPLDWAETIMALYEGRVCPDDVHVRVRPV